MANYCLMNCPGPSLLLNETIKTDHFYLGKALRLVSRYSLSPFWTSSSKLLQSLRLANRRGSGHTSITWTHKDNHISILWWTTDKSNIVWLSSLTMLTLLLSWAAFMIFLQVRSMVRYLFPSTGSWRLISSELKIGSIYSHDRWQMSHSSNTSYQQNTTVTQRLLVIVFGEDTYMQTKQTYKSTSPCGFQNHTCRMIGLPVSFSIYFPIWWFSPQRVFYMGRRPCSESLQCGHPGAEKLHLGSSRCKSLSPYKA